MKVHIISNSLKTQSGFSKVAENLLKGLTKLGHEVTITGMQTTYIPEYYGKIEVLPIETFYIDELSQLIFNINKCQSDIILCIFQADADLGYIAKSLMNVIWYVPVEGINISTNMANDINTVKTNSGKIIAQTMHGAGEMSINSFIYHGYNPNIFRHLKLNSSSKNKKSNIEETRYCYYSTEIANITSSPIHIYKHSCDCCNLSIKEQSLCPYYEKEKITILTYNGKWISEEIYIDELINKTLKKFVFGFVGQNFGVRKRIERLIEAYAEFVNSSTVNKDRTILHLHTMPISIQGIDLISIVKKYNIENNVIFSFGSTRSSAWSENAMGVLFNTFDCNVSASSGEGFGLPTLESIACGVPNIGPNFSSFIELIGTSMDDSPRGLLADLSDVQMIQDGSYRGLVSIGSFADCMSKMYTQKHLASEFSKNAVKFSKDFTWESICEQWDEVLNGFVNHTKK